jgi:hypothetical protein
MLIIGCDYHPGFQQIAFLDTDSGELEEPIWPLPLAKPIRQPTIGFQEFIDLGDW